MSDDEIQAKVRLLRENLERMSQIPQRDVGTFLADFRNVDSALRRLQTSIQALIDIGSHRLASLGLGAPRSSRDVLDRLEQAGHLPQGTADRFSPLIGFRNRVVHLYDRIDERIVFRILTEERDDIAELLALLLAIPDRP